MAHPCRVRLGTKRYPEEQYIHRHTLDSSAEHQAKRSAAGFEIYDYVSWYVTKDVTEAKIFLTKSAAKKYLELRPSLVAFIEPIPGDEHGSRETLSQNRRDL